MTKRFGQIYALRRVDFELMPGEVHALLGENGAGKSTLVKVLSGVHSPDDGLLEVYGKETTFRSPAESRSAGIAVVYQELSLVPSLSVSANLFLGREPCNRFGVVRKQEILDVTNALLDEYGFAIDAKALVGSLSFAHRQMTEILKALLGNVRILVLDEPTSALPSGEESALFEAIRHVTDRGVGVVYVTHRLREVFELSQRITVLRDGLEVGTFATVDIDMRGLVAAIIGRGHDQLASGTADAEGDDGSSEPKERYSSEAAPPTGEPFLDLRGVSNDRLRAVDLSVAPGEIVGLAGLAGSGRTEILETAFGLRPVVSGQMLIGGQAANLHNTSDAIQMGIAMVPEDRPGQGLVMSHSLEQNIAMPRLDKLTRLGLFQREASQARSREAMQELSIKAPTTHTIVGNLSGGNQQKVVFGKWRAPRPDLLLLDEPTTGVDVGAREEIYGVMRRAAAAGSAVLLVCSDLDELLQLCHRIAIVADGKVVLTVSRAEAGNEQNLHHLVNMSQPLGEEPRA